MTSSGIEPRRAHIIRLATGDDVLRGLEREVKRAGIENGVIVAGIGSTSSYHIHVVKGTGLPPGNVFFKKEAPFDIVCMQGYVLGGRVHAHVSLGDHVDGTQHGGHLEEGCMVLTFCVITIIETPPLGDLDRYPIR